MIVTNGIPARGLCGHSPDVTCDNCRPVQRSSQCPLCTPRCPHGYPVDVVQLPVITWSTFRTNSTDATPYGNLTVMQWTGEDTHLI